MLYKSYYRSCLGKIMLISDDEKLKYLGFLDLDEYEGEKLFLNDELTIMVKIKNWLDSYFKGENPPICFDDFYIYGSDYKKLVLNILCEIPYGKTLSYSDVSNIIKERTGKSGGARAVGRAIHNNQVAIIIPCHRVVGKNGCLTGYRYGLDIKMKLLDFEGNDMFKFYLPRIKEDKNV